MGLPGADGIDYLVLSADSPFRTYLFGLEWYLHSSVRISPNIEWVDYDDPAIGKDVVPRVTFDGRGEGRSSAARKPSFKGQGMNGWERWLPGLQVLSHYQAAWLPHDLMAGLVLTTMLVPVGIAYAVASGVPGIYGLYATIVPLLAYALFGPSRILVLGPDSSLAPVILASSLPLRRRPGACGRWRA